MPQSVQKLAAERVNALSGAAREAVLVAASLSRPTADAVMAALPDGLAGGAALAQAEDAGVLVTEHGRIRFTHPLLASAVYASVSQARRHALHHRLAEVVSDAEERARHLSQSLTEADESAAAEIEGAARRAVLSLKYPRFITCQRRRTRPASVRRHSRLAIDALLARACSQTTDNVALEENSDNHERSDRRR